MNINEIPDWVKLTSTIVVVGTLYWKLVAWKTSTDKGLAKLDRLESEMKASLERQNEKIERQNEKFFEMIKEIRDNREEMRLATKKD